MSSIVPVSPLPKTIASKVLDFLGDRSQESRVQVQEIVYALFGKMGRADFYQLGMMYKLGEGGVEQNNRRSFIYLKRAADKGHEEAALVVAHIYFIGWSPLTQSDNEEALRYCKMASPENWTALWHLGHMYEKGWGVEKDAKTALAFRIRAVRAGYPAPEKLLKDY